MTTMRAGSIALGGSVLACGSCATAILAAGGVADTDQREIAIGTQCAVHPSHAPSPATNVVRPPEGWTRPELAADAGDELAVLLEELPTTAGPVTMIAAQLLAAWTAGDDESADEWMVRRAVTTSRQLLRQTGGR